jgi:SAM-dependent methyltransferase
MAKVIKLTRCRMCAAEKLRLVLPLAATPVGDYYLPKEKHPEALECFSLDTYQCAECGHVQLAALVDPEYLYLDYLYTTTSSLGLPEHFKNYAASVCQKLSLGQGHFLVEIGSNDGTMLRAFQGQGLRVQGVDPARDISQKATAAGQPTINAFFTPELAEKIRAEQGAADLVIANNVLANVPDPANVVLGVQKLLGPNGVFVFETGYLKYLAEDVVFDNIYHEHIDYFSIRPLIRLLQRLGLQLFDVEVTASKGSSIRCYIQQESGKRSVAPIVEELVQHEIAADYATAAPYEKLAAFLEETKVKLGTMLRQWKAEGKIIAGYGASVGVTTVLYHFDLAQYLDFLVDDNAIKHQLYSPGLGLLVKDGACLTSEGAPDVVLILAWRYAESIMQRNYAYIQNGGEFVSILPEVQILTPSGTLPVH